MSFGINAGAYIYQGDLSPQKFGSLKTIQPGISFFAKKPVNSFLAARLHFAFGKLSGDESKYDNAGSVQGRNFYFSTPISELTAQVVWNIRANNKNEKGLIPYIFTGAGALFIKVKKDYTRLDPTLFPATSDVVIGLVIDNARATPRILFSVPAGAGAEFAISKSISLNAEMSYRFVFTDYLDGFSQSVNPKQQDHFYSASAGIIYKPGNRDKRMDCPVMKY